MTRAEQVKNLEAKIKRARANYNCQKLREDLQMEVRVSSAFWRQVRLEYEQELRAVKRKAWKHTME
jgi:hypothetical protein